MNANQCDDIVSFLTYKYKNPEPNSLIGNFSYMS